MNRIGISSRALDDLASVNVVFLGLVSNGAQVRQVGGNLHFGLPQSLAMRVAELGQAERSLLGACPFALCSYDFQEVDRWQRMLERRVSEPMAASGRFEAAGRRRQFTVMALGLIRSLAVQEPHAAALFFGMPPELTKAFAGSDLAQLPLVAARAESYLHARLADHPRFWPELLAAARGSSSQRQRAIRDMGLQLTLLRALRVQGSRSRGAALCRAF